jgi:hypothetical protein
MKKIVLTLIILFSSLAMFAQAEQSKKEDFIFISTYYLRDKPIPNNIRRNVVIVISEKEIQIQNFSDGIRTARTLILSIDKTEIKDWNLDGNCVTYYCHTKETDTTRSEQTAIVYISNSVPPKIILGLFTDEISVIKYKFSN